LLNGVFRPIDLRLPTFPAHATYARRHQVDHVFRSIGAVEGGLGARSTTTSMSAAGHSRRLTSWSSGQLAVLKLTCACG
jgi:hypothetical protein